jgi:hypothetical protein
MSLSIDPTFSISVITLISLLVNAVTIYRWITEYKIKKKQNDQAFHMIMGLALANTRRGSMIVNRMNALKEQGKQNDESMIFLENMYADSKSNIESLLASAKALKPESADHLPYDGDALLNKSRIESTNLMVKVKELEDKLSEKQ